MGLLSTNSSLFMTDTVSDGIVVLSPSPGDNSTATLTKSGSGTVRVKTLQNLGYVTVNNTNQLKIGNANLSLNGNGMIAALIRIPDLESLTSGYLRIFETTQTIPAGPGLGAPRFALTIRSKNFASSGRQIVVDTERNNGEAATASCSNSGWSNFPFDTSMLPFGNANTPRLYTGWIWVFAIRSTTSLTATITMTNAGTAPLAANTMQVGFCYADEDLTMSSFSSLAPGRNGGLGLNSAVGAIIKTSSGTGYTSAPTITISPPQISGGTQATATCVLSGSAIGAITLTNGGSGYTSAPTISFSGGGGTGAAATTSLQNSGGKQYFSGLDFVVGGTTGNSIDMDVAKIIKIDGQLETAMIMELFRGRSLQDVGVSPSANSFIINTASATSLTLGGFASTMPGFNSAQFKTTASDGPMCESEVGVVTSSTPLSVTISNGKVRL